MPVYLNACMYCMTVDLESWQVWRLFSRDPHRHYPRVSQVLTVEFRHRHLRTLKKNKQNLRNCVRRQPYTLKPRRKRREREDGESKMWSPFYLLSCKICRSIATQNIHQRRSADTKEGAGGAWFAIPGIPFFTSIYKTYILQQLLNNINLSRLFVTIGQIKTETLLNGESVSSKWD